MSDNLEHLITGTPPLSVTVSAVDSVTRISVAGDLDAFTAAQLTDAVARAVRDPGTVRVLIDAARLVFIDSAGVRCLLECHGRIEAAGRRFEMTDPSAAVSDVLTVSGLLEFFGLAQSRPDRRPPAPRRGPYRPRGYEQVLAETIAVRRAARETRERAAAMRESDALRRARVRGEVPDAPADGHVSRREADSSSPL